MIIVISNFVASALVMTRIIVTMLMINSTRTVKYQLLCLPAHAELGTCRTSIVKSFQMTFCFEHTLPRSCPACHCYPGAPGFSRFHSASRQFFDVSKCMQHLCWGHSKHCRIQLLSVSRKHASAGRPIGMPFKTHHISCLRIVVQLNLQCFYCTRKNWLSSHPSHVLAGLMQICYKASKQVSTACKGSWTKSSSAWMVVTAAGHSWACV